MAKTKTILITREIEDQSPLKEIKGVQLIGKAFIETTAVEGLNIPETDWIFFSSPQSVRLYFSHYKLKAKHIAALSEGTKKAVHQAGYKAEFTGNPKWAPPEIGQLFFEETIQSNQSVFFPLSNISKKSISSLKTSAKVIELTTYCTSLKSEVIVHQPDVILFTSPSNVDGFLQENSILSETILFSIGKTTAAHLKERGFSSVTFQSTSESAIKDELSSWISKQANY